MISAYNCGTRHVLIAYISNVTLLFYLFSLSSRINFKKPIKEVLMSQFENVTLVKQASVYFDGQVTSRTVLFADGTKKTLGIMMPGDYEFGTNEAELMEILAGELEVLLPQETEWQSIQGGESFNVPANASFKVKVKQLTDYCCSYIA